MRFVPSALQSHLNQPVTTTCRLLKITLTNGQSYGMTTLDTDVNYEGTVYSAINGFDDSNIASDIGLNVDNAEGFALLSADVPGIDVDMVKAGQLDDAQWEMLLINFENHSMGHLIIDSGDIGEVRIVDDQVYMPELLSYSMRLRQSIGNVWSRTCRATFGTPPSSQTGCGVDVEPLWQSGVVTGIGSEQRRVFANAGLVPASSFLPGRVQWLTGNNTANRLYQVEGFSDISGTIALLENTPFIIAIGDTFRIRPDCDKRPETCKAFNNFINYKGEPFIPVGEGAESLTPGASIAGGFVGSEISE